MKMSVPQFCFWTPSLRRTPCTSCSTYRDIPLSKGGGLFTLASTQHQLAPLLGQNLSMADPEAVLSEASPLNAPHNISPQTTALDTTPPEAPLVESPFDPSVDNVTRKSILYRPLHSQITIFWEEEEGEVSGSFTLEGEQFDTVHFMDLRMDLLCLTGIVVRVLTR